MIQNHMTIGAGAGAAGRFYGTTNEEMFGRVNKEVETQVQEIGDRLVIQDVDKSPDLKVGFQKAADGATFLSVKNSDPTGEFVTDTKVEIPLKEQEVPWTADLADIWVVKGVTVQPATNGTLITLEDVGYSRKRYHLVDTDGHFHYDLREGEFQTKPE